MHPFSSADIKELADKLMRSGLHPSRVRARLAEEGIRWAYQFLEQGRRERLRRLKKVGRNLCPSPGCQSGKPIDQPLCETCLVKKWAPEGAQGGQS